MGERARVRLIRASQSDELRQLFRQLSELEGPYGPKFSRRVLLDLAARVTGRAYEPTLLEVCHLARAAMLYERCIRGGRNAVPGAVTAGFEWLFWGVETARADAFQAAFAHPCEFVESTSARPPGGDGGDEAPAGTGGALSVGSEGVTLFYTDGRFELRYARMARLAAMMELLVSSLGYRVLASVLDPLSATVAKRDAVSGAARELARRLYEWLGDHLPAAQAQRKFHSMISFLEGTLGPDFTEDDIDDETVLRFWLRHVGEGTGESTGASADFRGYRNTFLAFLALARVLAAGAEIGRFERQIPIGSDFEAGEVDPAAGAPMPEWTADDDPLARLQEPPAGAVKALNRRELALLRMPVGECVGVRRLPRSYLRAECFGPVQNRLSQALRRRMGPEGVAAIVEAGPESGYRACIESLERTDAHLRRVAKACLYVLHRMGGTGGDGGGDVAHVDVPELDFRLLGEARKAFDGLNRAGFERSAPGDPRLAPAYRALAEELPSLSERLGAVLHTFGPPQTWEAAEAEDRPVFAHALTRLYKARASGTRAPSETGDRASPGAGGVAGRNATTTGGCTGPSEERYP